MTIVQPGMLTTVQDLGRPGHRAIGVPIGGACDTRSMRLANMAVGNSPDAAVLECTLIGPQFRFSRDSLIAVSGATSEHLPANRPITIPARRLVNLERLAFGARMYVAIAGGIDVPQVMGSRSTDVRCSWGGFKGRALHKGDRLSIGEFKVCRSSAVGVNPNAFDCQENVLRIARGQDCSEFAANLEDLTYKVSSESDRMGVRLRGPTLVRQPVDERLSQAVVPGTIQVPPDGQPIILLADAQTIGGYPIIAHVIAADLPHAAQCRPGGTVRFQFVSLEQAHLLWIEHERTMALIQQGFAAGAR